MRFTREQGFTLEFVKLLISKGTITQAEVDQCYVDAEEFAGRAQKMLDLQHKLVHLKSNPGAFDNLAQESWETFNTIDKIITDAAPEAEWLLAQGIPLGPVATAALEEVKIMKDHPELIERKSKGKPPPKPKPEPFVDNGDPNESGSVQYPMSDAGKAAAAAAEAKEKADKEKDE